jgi:hypothetical protein
LAGRLHQLRNSTLGPGSLFYADWNFAVAGLRLHPNQCLQGVGELLPVRPNPLQQAHRLSVILALSVLTKRPAANHVRGRDTGVNAQRDKGISHFSLVARELPDGLSGIEELSSLAHTPGNRLFRAGSPSAGHLRVDLRRWRNMLPEPASEMPSLEISVST